MEITSSIEIDFPHTPVLNITSMIEKSIADAKNVNMTEILTETETLTGLSDFDKFQDDLAQNEVALKAVINKAKEITKTHYLGHRISTLESIFKYGGISFGIIAFLLTVAWKFSLFRKLSSLRSILSCVSKYKKREHPKLISEPQNKVVSYYRQPIELVETPAPATTSREVAVITQAPAQIEHRPVYALTYLNRDELP